MYVRGEIVHNTHVVSSLREKGAIFVAQRERGARGRDDHPVPHGVSPKVHRVVRRAQAARHRTRPARWWARFHAEVRRDDAARELTVLLVGHEDHDEVIGTGARPPPTSSWCRTSRMRSPFQVPDPERVALSPPRPRCRSTTPPRSSRRLERRFPALLKPASSDICLRPPGPAGRRAHRRAERRRPRAGGRFSQLSNSNRMVEWPRPPAPTGTHRQRRRDGPGVVRRQAACRPHRRRQRAEVLVRRWPHADAARLRARRVRSCRARRACSSRCPGAAGLTRAGARNRAGCPQPQELTGSSTIGARTSSPSGNAAAQLLGVERDARAISSRPARRRRRARRCRRPASTHAALRRLRARRAVSGESAPSAVLDRRELVLAARLHRGP